MGLVSHSWSASLTWLKMLSCFPERPYHFACPGVWCGFEDRKWRPGEVKWLTSDHKANEEMWVRVLENCEFPVLHTFIKLRFKCSFHILQENCWRGGLFIGLFAYLLVPFYWWTDSWEGRFKKANDLPGVTRLVPGWMEFDSKLVLLPPRTAPLDCRKL